MLVSGPERDFVRPELVSRLRGGEAGPAQLPVRLPRLTEVGGNRARHLDWTVVAGLEVTGGQGGH